MSKTVLSGVAAVAAVAAAPVMAQEAGSRQTREYVQAAGHSGAFEIMEADTVLAKSADPQVRAFAQAMIQDHNRLGQALLQATEQAGLKPPPTTVGADQAPLLAALESAKAPDLDREYWRHQVLGHRSALVTTQEYVANGDDPAIRKAAQASLPTISAHLAMAEQMQEKSSGM